MASKSQVPLRSYSNPPKPADRFPPASWHKALERLDAGTLIETVAVFRGGLISVNDMFHFGEEVRVGDLEVIFVAMGSQRVIHKYAMYGREADGPID